MHDDRASQVLMLMANPLNQTRRCWFIESMMKLFGFSLADSSSMTVFSPESRYVKVSTRGMTVLSRVFFMNAKRGQMEDLFGNLVWAVHSGPEREKVSVFKVRWLL